MKWSIDVEAPYHLPDLEGYPVKLPSVEAATKQDAASKAGKAVRSHKPPFDQNARVTITGEDGSTAYDTPQTVDQFLENDQDHPRAGL